MTNNVTTFKDSAFKIKEVELTTENGFLNITHDCLITAKGGYYEDFTLNGDGVVDTGCSKEDLITFLKDALAMLENS